MADQRDMEYVDSERVVSGATAAMMAVAFLIVWVMCWHARPHPVNVDVSDMPTQTMALHTSMAPGFSSDMP